MAEIQNRVAIVEPDGDGFKIVSVTKMTEQQIGEILTEIEQLRQDNNTLRQAKAYHATVTMQNNAELRIILDSLLRTGILQNSQINITAALKPIVRKITDDYEYEKQIFVRLEKFGHAWRDLAVSFFKNGILKSIIKKFQKK
jgi:predicted PilT family ATPase